MYPIICNNIDCTVIMETKTAIPGSMKQLTRYDGPATSDIHTQPRKNITTMNCLDLTSYVFNACEQSCIVMIMRKSIACLKQNFNQRLNQISVMIMLGFKTMALSPVAICSHINVFKHSFLCVYMCVACVCVCVCVCVNAYMDCASTEF